MDLKHDEFRRSDCPLIDHVWHSTSKMAGSFISIADIHFSLVVTRLEGKTWVTFKGPETSSSIAFAPPDSEWFGVVFKPGVYLRSLPPSLISDRQDITLPASGLNRFSLLGYSIEAPNFSNAEDLVNRLLRLGLIEYDHLPLEVLDRRILNMSERNIQRRFQYATGLVPVKAFQVLRARTAALLLKNGGQAAAVAQEVGYFDQSHMTRSLKRFIGLTPSSIVNPDRVEILSFLYQDEIF